jgi:hypothetical protein
MRLAHASLKSQVIGVMHRGAPGFWHGSFCRTLQVFPRPARRYARSGAVTANLTFPLRQFLKARV